MVSDGWALVETVPGARVSRRRCLEPEKNLVFPITWAPEPSA